MKREADKHIMTGSHKRRILSCLLFSLILAIAGREVPEFVNLTDDPSNDGTIVLSVQEAVPQISSRRMTPQERCRYKGKLVLFENFRNFHSVALATSIPGRDLLHLLSLQRK
jgi:hypothetical protein